MKKLLFITLLLLSSLPANAQHLDSLLNDLFQLEIRDLPNHEKLAKEIFEIDPFNESVCYSLCLSYDRNKQGERKNKFFEELKEKYPRRPEPWILSAEFNCWALRTEDTTCFPELDMALQIDSTNVKGYFLYARTLYRHSQLNFKKDSIKYSRSLARRARENMKQAIKYDSSLYNTLRLAIYQISNLIGDTIDYQQYLRSNSHNWCSKDDYPYFLPLEEFRSHPDDWKSNFSFNLIRSALATESKVERYTKALAALDEKKLCAGNSNIVYRFLWLRSFHRPLTITIRKINSEYELMWTFPKDGEQNSLNPRLNYNKKSITEAEWKEFIQHVEYANFWNLETRSKRFGFDGAHWIIESLAANKYHVADRWAPNKSDFAEIGKFLISLTDMDLTEGEVY